MDLDGQQDRGIVTSARLQDLLLEPREALEMEIKGWLNLADGEAKADLAKALIALANHGGGHVLIGFGEVGGRWEAASPHPGDMSVFSQDVISSAVDRFAEPVFHCETIHVRHPTTGLKYPVIRVPAGRTPIRTRSACPCEKHVKAHVYYVRRAGPKSEAPQSGQEWQSLIERCVRSNRDDLLSGIRSLLEGANTKVSNPELAAPEDPLESFVKNSRGRFAELVAKRLVAEQPSRFQHGVWTIAYRLGDPARKPTLGELQSILEKVELNHTGWPEWVVLHRQELEPYPFEGLLECFLVDGRLADAGHSDFWRVSKRGDAFLLRGYQEDSNRDRLEPGKYLDITLPAWRVGEALLHAARLSEALNSTTPFRIRAEWEGLEGRSLTSVGGGRFMREGYICRQKNVAAEAEVSPASVSDSLPELVRELTTDLYEAFSLFRPPLTMFAEELDKMRKNRY